MVNVINDITFPCGPFITNVLSMLPFDVTLYALVFPCSTVYFKSRVLESSIENIFIKYTYFRNCLISNKPDKVITFHNRRWLLPDRK